MTTFRDPLTHTEFHSASSAGKLNWLRAAVLGANDGIVSIASVILVLLEQMNPRTLSSLLVLLPQLQELYLWQ